MDALAGQRCANRQNLSGTPTLIFSGPHRSRELEPGVPSFKQISAAMTAVS